MRKRARNTLNIALKLTGPTAMWWRPSGLLAGVPRRRVELIQILSERKAYVRHRVSGGVWLTREVLRQDLEEV